MIPDAERLKEPTRIANLRKRLQRIEQTKQRFREGGPPPDRRQIAALSSEIEIREEIAQWEQFGILKPTVATPPTPPAFPGQASETESLSVTISQQGVAGIAASAAPAIIQDPYAEAGAIGSSSAEAAAQLPGIPVTVADFPHLLALQQPAILQREQVYALAYPTAERTEKEPTRIVNLRRRLQRILTTRERMETPGLPPPDNRQLAALAAESEIVWEIQQWENYRIIYPLKPEMRYIPPGALGTKGDKAEKTEKLATSGENPPPSFSVDCIGGSAPAPKVQPTPLTNNNLGAPASEVHGTRSLPNPSLMPIHSGIQSVLAKYPHSEDAFSNSPPGSEGAHPQHDPKLDADVNNVTSAWTGEPINTQTVPSSSPDFHGTTHNHHQPGLQQHSHPHRTTHSPYESPPEETDIPHSYVACPASAATIANVESWAQSVREARAEAHRRRKEQQAKEHAAAAAASSQPHHHLHHHGGSPTSISPPSSVAQGAVCHGVGANAHRAISPTKAVDLRQALLAKYIELKLDKGEHPPGGDHHSNTDSSDHMDHSAHSSFRRGDARERSASEPSDHEFYDKLLRRSTSAEYLPSPFAGRRTNSFDDLTRPLSMESLDSPLASPTGQASNKREAFRELIQDRVPDSPASRIRKRGGMLLEHRFYGNALLHHHHPHSHSSTALSSASSGEPAPHIDSDPDKSASPRSPESDLADSGGAVCSGCSSANKEDSTSSPPQDGHTHPGSGIDGSDKWANAEHSQHRKRHSTHSSGCPLHPHHHSDASHRKHHHPSHLPMQLPIPLQHQIPPAACLPGTTPTTGGSSSSSFSVGKDATHSPPTSDVCGMSLVTIPSCSAEGSWSVVADSGGGGHYPHSGSGHHVYPRQPLPCLRRRSTHFLENSWTLWFNESLMPQHDGHPALAYEEGIVELGCFNTIEGFWMYWNNLRIACLVDNCNLRVFKTGIRPIWEDPHNAEGGRWVARHLPKAKRSKLWSDLVMAMVGELIEDNTHDVVCGAVLSTRDDGDSIQLWTDGGYYHRHKPDQVYQGDEYRQGLPPPQQKLKEIFHHDPDVHFTYQKHFPHSGSGNVPVHHHHEASASTPKNSQKEHCEPLTKSKMELFLSKCAESAAHPHSSHQFHSHHAHATVQHSQHHSAHHHSSYPTSTSPISYPSPVPSPSHKTLSPLPPPPGLCACSSAFISPISSMTMPHPHNIEDAYHHHQHHHAHGFLNEIPRETSSYGDLVDSNAVAGTLDHASMSALTPASSAMASPLTPITPTSGTAGTGHSPTTMGSASSGGGQQHPHHHQHSPPLATASSGSPPIPFEPLTTFTTVPSSQQQRRTGPSNGTNTTGGTGRTRPRPPPVHTSPDSEVPPAMRAVAGSGALPGSNSSSHISPPPSQVSPTPMQPVAILRSGPAATMPIGLSPVNAQANLMRQQLQQHPFGHPQHQQLLHQPPHSNSPRSGTTNPFHTQPSAPHVATQYYHNPPQSLHHPQ